jgi:hypothetical protein
LEDGGFADAGGEGREVGSEGGREGGRGGGDFVAETVKVFLRGGDGAGGEELLKPDLELLVVTAVGFVPEKGEE